MTEFDSSWHGWQWQTSHSRIADTLAHPDKGIALVRVEDSPRQMLADLERANEQRIADTDWTTYLSYTQPLDGSEVRDKTQGIAEIFPDFETRVQSLMTALRAVMEPAAEGLELEPPNCQVLQLIIAKRLEQRGHVDPVGVRAWIGATKPGFFVDKDGRKITINGLPEGHVLLMRGKQSYQGGIRHGALYRGQEPRLNLLDDVRYDPYLNGKNWGDL